MKHSNPLRLYFTSLAICIYLTLSACGSGKRPSGDQPYKSIVVALTDVDAAGSAHFGLVEKSFTSLTDLDSLDGTYAKILRGGQLTISEVNGSLVSSDGFTGGTSPDLRYTVSDGVVIPSDYSTLAMLSAYYQLDYIYANLSKVLGIEPTVLTAKYPGGKHTVLFEPLIKLKQGGTDITAGIKLNAAFSPKDKQFLLFQRSTIESVPLSGNLQVMSHEFGHAVFDNVFLDGVYDEKNYLSESYALRGLNEGWADFISSLYTGCYDILRASIDIDDIAKQRNISKSTFKWDDIVSQTLGNSSGSEYGKCSGSFYCIGTVFARSLVQSRIALSETVDAKTFAAGLIDSIRKAQAEIKAMPSIVTVAVSSDGDDPDTNAKWQRQSQFTSAFIRAMIKNVPAAWQGTMCTKFIDNFGANGFSKVARDGVCP